MPDLPAIARRDLHDEAHRATDTISVLTVTTLFPNPIQPAHGIFVETRLRELIETGAVRATVLAPIPWVPPNVDLPRYGPLYRIPDRHVSHGLDVEHPRYLAIPKIGMLSTPLTLFLAMRARLERMLRAGVRVSIIDAHYFYPDGVAAVWLGRAFDIPVVVTARGTDLNLIPQSPIPRRLIRNAAARADGLVTVCQALKDCLIELGVEPERITVLRNGVDLARFSPCDRTAARSRFGLSRRTLGSVGHLIERKGHHHVIRALADLPDTDLLIVGAGPERASLERLTVANGVADRVRFLGMLDQASLAEFYSAIDALVLASSREGWANVLLEAMACGTPVVASAVWGTPEIVTAPAAGVLMPSLDARGVASGVEALFDAPIDRRATRKFAEQFDWRPTSAGQLGLFRSVLARRYPKSSA